MQKETNATARFYLSNTYAVQIGRLSSSQILDNAEITTIGKCYGAEMLEVGFYIIEGEPFNSDTDFILGEDVIKMFDK